MRSSSNVHLTGLDQLRFFAAFQVLFWHFSHLRLDDAYVPSLAPLSLLEEGHTGVSLFIVISGFIFTHLCYGREIAYGQFLFNRFLRLFPLLFVTFLLARWLDDAPAAAFGEFLLLMNRGGVYGVWTIAVEIQFYLLFPFFVGYAYRRWPVGWQRYVPFIGLIALGAGFRVLALVKTGQAQDVAFWSIFGRIDQFMLGAMACLALRDMEARLQPATLRWFGRALLLAGVAGLSTVLHLFNLAGGFHHNPGYPSPSRYWLIQPTVEGLLYACVVVGWVIVAGAAHGRISRLFAYLGAISYSSYMLHFVTIGFAQRVLEKYGISLSSDPFTNAAWLTVLWAFPVTTIFASLSYELIEKPFLQRRAPYLRGALPSAAGPAG